MRAQKLRIRAWRKRSFGLAVLLALLVVAPLGYCVFEAGEAGAVGMCMDGHVLRIPEVLALGSLFCVFFGVVLGLRERTLVRDEEALQRRVEQAARRAAHHTPALDAAAMRGTRRKAPEVIEVEEDLGIGVEPAGVVEEEESVMSFVQEREARQAESRRGEQEPRPELAGVYCPPGMEGAPVLYVDGAVTPSVVPNPEDRIDSPDLPHTELEDALRQAFDLVMSRGEPVMIRVMPGVYQARLEIPDRVVVVNHRLPAEATIDQRRTWLEEQDHVDHPDRVTLLAPSHSRVGVQMLPGQKQGLFGCYLVARKGVGQTGLKVTRSVATAVVHCAIEGFSRGGALVESSGEPLAGREVQFVGCIFRGNANREAGGGLLVRESAVTVEASEFDSNRAPDGGAIAVEGEEKPLRLKRCLLQRNRALVDEEPEAVQDLDFLQWQKLHGLGGGLVVRGGMAKAVDCIFDGNDAAVAGGAVAAVGGKVVLQGTSTDRAMISENRADAGGGVFAVGWSDEPGMVRLTGVAVLGNVAKTLGGGVGAVGRATVRLEEAVVEQNHAAGGAHGLGGGVAVWRGATLQGRELVVSSNRADSSGGGVAVLNASVSLVEGTTLNRNVATGGSGGGLLVLTMEDHHLERLVNQEGFEMPLKCKIDGVRITQNQANGAGGGLRAGNRGRAPTFPIALAIRRPDWVVDNSSEEKAEDFAQICIRWAGEVVRDDNTRGRIKEILR